MTNSDSEVSAGTRFAFGANWMSFVDLVDDPRAEAARLSLIEALDLKNLSGRTFLDVGCGSGLFSFAAHQLGAARVHSFDFDPDSVAAANQLRHRLAPKSDWAIEQGSILDTDYVASLGFFDIVYSWGVLHHTGHLWRAIDAAARLVAPGGLLFISVYNDQGRQSRIWRRVKREYNASGRMKRKMLVMASQVYLLLHQPANNLIKILRRTSVGTTQTVRPRGMSASHDLLDWVGGYPFEVARPEEVFAFIRQRGFELRHLKTTGGGLGCNEYVFERLTSGVPSTGCQSREATPE